MLMRDAQTCPDIYSQLSDAVDTAVIMRAEIEDGVYATEAATEAPVLIDKGVIGTLYAGGKF